MKMAQQHSSMEAVTGKSVGLLTGTQQDGGASLPGQTELKPSQIW